MYNTVIITIVLFYFKYECVLYCICSINIVLSLKSFITAYVINDRLQFQRTSALFLIPVSVKQIVSHNSRNNLIICATYMCSVNEFLLFNCKNSKPNHFGALKKIKLCAKFKQ